MNKFFKTLLIAWLILASTPVSALSLSDFFPKQDTMFGAGSGTITPLPIKSFLGLNDTPDTYAGQSGNAVIVNASSTGLTFGTISSADEKVKYSAGTNAVYLGEGTKAGTGISLAQGTGADIDKLVITNSDTGSSAVSTHEGTYDHTLIATALQSESDPLSLHLDQTMPQTVTGGIPNFSAGIQAQTVVIPDGTNTILGSGYLEYGSGLRQIQVATRQLGFDSGAGFVPSVDWANRQLIKSDGTTVAFDWENASVSGVNTGDQDLSGYLTSATASTTYAKLDGTNQPFTGDVNISKSSAKITATNTGGNAKTISLLADNATDASYIKGVTGVPASTPIGLNVDGVGLTTSDTSTFNFAKTDPFSVEFWFSGSTVYPFNFTEWLGTRGGVGAGWVLSLISTNNTYNTGIALQLYDSGGNYRRAYAYSSIYSSQTTNGAYKHIVFVSNGDGTFNLYINGSSTSITTDGTAFASLGDIAGGKALTMSSSVSDYDPRIDELVIWNKALSGGEISARYASGAGLYQTETAETLSIWHFDNDKLNSVAGKNAWTDTSGTSTFVPGVVTAPPSDSEVQVIKLSDGISAGAKGTLEFGNVSSDTVLNGGKLDFSIANTVKATMRSTGMDYQTKLGVLTPTVISEGSAEFSALTANNYPLVLTGYAATTGARPFLLTRQARGTISSPTATQSGDIISGIGGRGYYTGSFSSTATASHIMWAAENFTSTAQGTYQTFTTTPIGSITPAERLRITSDGYVGIGTTAPSQITHIKKDQNAGTILLVDNATNGTGAGAFVRVQNNTPVIAQLGIYSSGTTSYGAISGGDASVYTTTSLVLMADNGLGQIKFASGGTGEKMRLTEAGRLGIGTTTPAALIHGIKTTEQLRLGYDTSNYLSMTVGSTGSVTTALTGTSPINIFSQAIRGNGGFQSSDGSAGLTATRIFNDGAVVNTVTIKNGLITDWTQI